MQTVKLGTICDIQAGGTPSRAEPVYWKNGTIPWVKISDFDGGNVRTTEESITQEGLDNSSAKLFPKGTILYTIFATLGEVAVLQMEAATNQAIAGLHLHDERIDAAYLYYFLISIKEKVLRLGRGVTQNNINLKILRNIDVPVTHLAEQQRIVRELQQVGALLANRRQVDEKLAELPKARFVEMFGDPVVNPMGWEKQRISNISIRANNGMARRGNDPDGNIVLRLVELQDGYIDYQAPNRILLTPGEKEKYLLTEGDFLFARVNGNPENVGRCAVFHDIGEPVYHNDHIIRYHFNQHIDGTYLSALLNSYYGKWQMHSKIKTSAGQYTISQDSIGEVEVPLPPLDLQRRFAAFARACAAQRAACARQIAVLETLRGKLLQDAFGAAG